MLMLEQLETRLVPSATIHVPHDGNAHHGDAGQGHDGQGHGHGNGQGQDHQDGGTPTPPSPQDLDKLFALLENVPDWSYDGAVLGYYQVEKAGGAIRISAPSLPFWEQTAWESLDSGATWHRYLALPLSEDGLQAYLDEASLADQQAIADAVLIDALAQLEGHKPAFVIA